MSGDIFSLWLSSVDLQLDDGGMQARSVSFDTSTATTLHRNAQSNTMGSKLHSTTGDLPHLDVLDASPGLSCSELRSKTKFHPAVRVVLIPTRDEYTQAGVSSSLWWSDEDYLSFKESGISEIRECMGKFECSNKLAIHRLYQSCDLTVCEVCRQHFPTIFAGLGGRHTTSSSSAGQEIAGDGPRQQQQSSHQSVVIKASLVTASSSASLAAAPQPPPSSGAPPGMAFTHRSVSAETKKAYPSLYPPHASPHRAEPPPSVQAIHVSALAAPGDLSTFAVAVHSPRPAASERDNSNTSSSSSGSSDSSSSRGSREGSCSTSTDGSRSTQQQDRSSSDEDEGERGCDDDEEEEEEDKEDADNIRIGPSFDPYCSFERHPHHCGSTGDDANILSVPALDQLVRFPTPRDSGGETDDQSGRSSGSGSDSSSPGRGGERREARKRGPRGGSKKAASARREAKPRGQSWRDAEGEMLFWPNV